MKQKLNKFIMTSLITIPSITLISCSPLDMFGLSSKTKIIHNETKIKSGGADVECKTKNVSRQNSSYILESFFCDFEAFDIEVLEIPEMSTKEFAFKTYNWILNNVFYGSEILTLDKIVFDGSESSKTLFGSYSPYFKSITVFPKNAKVTYGRKIPTWVAERFDKEEITPYDLEYWQYTLSHEYGHHQSFIYASTNKIQKLVKEEGETSYDFELNETGNKFINDFMLFKNREENKNLFKAKPINAYTSGRTKCRLKKDDKDPRKDQVIVKNWPTRNITKSFNEYRWTSAERLTRAIQLLTFQVPPELHNKDSVLAYGGISDDYWWFNYYDLNTYENYFDKNCTPRQEELNVKLNEFKNIMQNEWFNKKDNIISGAALTYRKKLYLFSQFKNKKIEFKSKKQTITFSEKGMLTNTYYNWRPFDSRKQTKFRIGSIPYVSDKKIPSGLYEVYVDGKRVKKSLGLKTNQQKLLISTSKYFDLFEMRKDGLTYRVI